MGRSWAEVTALTMAGLLALIHGTKLGRAMRATAENPRVAQLMGVQPDKVISATFIIGAALAALAGVMWAANYGSVQHTMGFLPGLKAFTAAVFGGIGNLGGAMVGGLLLGVIEAMGAGYIGELTGDVLGAVTQATMLAATTGPIPSISWRASSVTSRMPSNVPM